MNNSDKDALNFICVNCGSYVSKNTQFLIVKGHLLCDAKCGEEWANKLVAKHREKQTIVCYHCLNNFPPALGVIRFGGKVFCSATCVESYVYKNNLGMMGGAPPNTKETILPSTLSTNKEGDLVENSKIIGDEITTVTIDEFFKRRGDNDNKA